MLDLCLGSFQEEREGQGGRGLLSKAGFSSGRLAAATAESLQSCLTLCDPIDGSPPLLCPWDSPGKNTGVVSLPTPFKEFQIKSLTTYGT